MEEKIDCVSTFPLNLRRQSRQQQTTVLNIFSVFFFFSSEKLRLDVSCESSAMQRIHVKHQALFSSKDKSQKLNKINK